MTKAYWQRVKYLFAEAIEHPADSRLEFLRGKCNGDDPLFSEVSSLLAAASEPENLIRLINFIIRSTHAGSSLKSPHCLGPKG
jgi:hypothetical protein